MQEQTLPVCGNTAFLRVLWHQNSIMARVQKGIEPKKCTRQKDRAKVRLYFDWFLEQMMTFRILTALWATIFASIGMAASAATVTIGYSYNIVNAEVDAIQLPSVFVVADPDGYFLNFGVNTVAAASGSNYDFAVPVTMFSITDIDPALGLDPANNSAFPLGVTLVNITGQFDLIVTPITANIPAVPLPASLPLLAVAMGGFSVLRRRKVP